MDGWSATARGASQGCWYKPVAGASPLFPPRGLAEASAEVAEVIHRSPTLYGQTCSRWQLDTIRQQVDWMKDLSLSGVRGLLMRLKVVYKRGRRWVHSPDPHYDDKLKAVADAEVLVRTEPARFALLYQDELTYYRRPTVAQGYALRGSDGPRALQGWGSNTAYRIAGSLDILTGQFLAWQRAHFDRHTLIRYYLDLQTHYPHAERIYLVQDNWPVHFHEDIVAALASTRITLLPLPTYAPWTNPTEKVWRKLYQDVLHLHSDVNAWNALKARVTAWLDALVSGSLELLRYVGLYPT